MLVIPWWHLYPWWPFVAFSSLLWPVGVFAWWFVVQSATSMDTAVFCGICDNYGIYGGTVGLQCISNLFLVIFTPRRGFSAKFGCFGWKVIFSNIAISISAAIHPCFKHAVSHVARVCASSRTPLIMCVFLVNLTNLFVDGFGFEHDLNALWSLLGSGFWMKPVAGSQWHWGLRCLASIFGIRLIIFVFGDFGVCKERFCGNASHPVVAFVSVVAFCGLF